MGLFELALFLQKSAVFFQSICAPLGMHFVTNESGREPDALNWMNYINKVLSIPHPLILLRS